MQNDQIIKLGEIFEVEASDTRVRTKLQEIMDNGDLVVLQPTVKGVPLRAEEYEGCRFSYFRPNGIYRFETQMISSFIKEGVWLCRFRQTSDVKKIQRRQCYRLPIVLDVVLSPCGETAKEESPCKYKAKTINLSEKSVQLRCFSALDANTDMNINIRLSETETMMLKGTVLRCIAPLRKTDPYEIVLLFTDCPACETTQLRRYIFRQQIIARNKGVE